MEMGFKSTFGHWAQRPPWPSLLRWFGLAKQWPECELWQRVAWLPCGPRGAGRSIGRVPSSVAPALACGSARGHDLGTIGVGRAAARHREGLHRELRRSTTCRPNNRRWEAEHRNGVATEEVNLTRVGTRSDDGRATRWSEALWEWSCTMSIG
jgi:hypothetical protein